MKKSFFEGMDSSDKVYVAGWIATMFIICTIAICILIFNINDESFESHAKIRIEEIALEKMKNPCSTSEFEGGDTLIIVNKCTGQHKIVAIERNSTAKVISR